MNCHAFRNVRDLFEEGRLAPKRAAQALAHLRSCADCRALAAPATASTAVFAPAALKARLVAAARSAAAAPSVREKTSLPLWPREAPAIALAAAALALVGLWIAATGVASQSAAGAPTVAVEEP
jgi:hypothetical protein